MPSWGACSANQTESVPLHIPWLLPGQTHGGAPGASRSSKAGKCSFCPGALSARMMGRVSSFHTPKLGWYSYSGIRSKGRRVLVTFWGRGEVGRGKTDISWGGGGEHRLAISLLLSFLSQLRGMWCE